MNVLSPLLLAQFFFHSFIHAHILTHTAAARIILASRRMTNDVAISGSDMRIIIQCIAWYTYSLLAHIASNKREIESERERAKKANRKSILKNRLESMFKQQAVEYQILPNLFNTFSCFYFIYLPYFSNNSSFNLLSTCVYSSAT